MKIKRRRRAREIRIGNVKIGGNNPIAVQSMAKTFTSDLSATVSQIKQLELAGCQIVRVAVRNNQDATALKKIKQQISIPLVADIHFDKNLAIQAIESGVDKIRLNPGNIYKKKEVKEIAKAAKCARIPIRLGVNSGSIRGFRLHTSGHSSGIRNRTQSANRNTQYAEEMARCALDYIKLLEGAGFYDIVVSLKGSDIFTTIQANERIAKSCAYPLHLGITATGPILAGIIKSAMAIGRLLSEGIGDTIRVSLTDRAVQEVKTAFYILQALGLGGLGPEIISCPTCGRCEIDLIKIVKELDNKINQSIVHNVQWSIDKNYRLSTIDYRLPLKVAIMGCVVNGPGEARQADLGVAFGKSEGLLFRKGKPIRKVPFKKCVDTLLQEISRCVSS